MSNWLKVFLLISLIGCSQRQKQCDVLRTNYDSLYKIGDEALIEMYINDMEQELAHDSLSNELQQKRKYEYRNRIVYIDSIVYVMDTICLVDSL